jgi:hypothetical protein
VLTRNTLEPLGCTMLVMTLTQDTSS